MSNHPDDDTLIATPRNVADHMEFCERCKTRSRRLRTGKALIEMARGDVAPSVDWSRIDAKVMAAAESTVEGMRVRALRPARPARALAYAGVTLAAAAASVFVVHTTPSRRVAREPVTAVHTVPPVATPSTEGAPIVEPVIAQAAESAEALVLMVVAPVGYTPRGGGPVPLEGTSTVREGGRIAVEERGGRVVMALPAGFRLDARAGTDVTFERFVEGHTVLALAKGEARIDGPSRSDQHMALTTFGWSIAAKGGAFVAKVESDGVRVQVLSGKLSVSHDGAPDRELFAGDEVVLEEGTAIRVVSHEARDANALNMAFLAEDGRLFQVPVLPMQGGAAERASVTVEGFGTLPAGVSSIRAHAPVALHAQVGTASFAMVLATSAQNTPHWNRVAARTLPVRTAPVAAPAPVIETPIAVVQPAAPTAPPIAVPAPEVPGPAAGGGTVTLDGLEHELAARSAHCFDECRTTGTCGSGHYAYVAIDPEPDGHVSGVRLTGFSSAELSTCVERAAHGLRVPTYMVGTQQLHLESPVR